MGIRLNDVAFEYQPIEEAIIKSRHSRYFSMRWFEMNYVFASRKLTFGQMVAEALDYNKWRMTVRKSRRGYEFNFWPMKSGKLQQNGVCSIRISKKGNVLNIPKRLCIDNRFIYAIAIKLRMLDIPKKWKTIKVLFNRSGYRVKLLQNVEDDNIYFEVSDRFYNCVKIPVKMDFFGTLNFIRERYENYKPVTYSDKEKFLKSVRKFYGKRYASTTKRCAGKSLVAGLKRRKKGGMFA